MPRIRVQSQQLRRIENIIYHFLFRISKYFFILWSFWHGFDRPSRRFSYRNSSVQFNVCICCFFLPSILVFVLALVFNCCFFLQSYLLAGVRFFFLVLFPEFKAINWIYVVNWEEKCPFENFSIRIIAVIIFWAGIFHHLTLWPTSAFVCRLRENRNSTIFVTTNNLYESE